MATGNNHGAVLRQTATPATVFETTKEESSSSQKQALSMGGARPTGPVGMFQLSGLQAAAALAPGLWRSTAAA